MAAAICHCDDVAASLVPTVAAGGFCVFLDVAASLWPAVAGSLIS